MILKLSEAKLSDGSDQLRDKMKVFFTRWLTTILVQKYDAISPSCVNGGCRTIAKDIACADCKVAVYCSERCLKQHAKLHKLICESLSKNYKNSRENATYRLFLSNLSVCFTLYPDSAKILGEVRRTVAKKQGKSIDLLCIIIDISDFDCKEYSSPDMCIEFMSKLYSGGLNISVLCKSKIAGYKPETEGFINIYFMTYTDFSFCFSTSISVRNKE